MVPPPLRLTGELILSKDENTAMQRQLNAMDRKLNAMDSKLERLLDCAENESTLARSAPSTAAVNNGQSGHMIRYSVYATSDKKGKQKSLILLEILWPAKKLLSRDLCLKIHHLSPLSVHSRKAEREKETMTQMMTQFELMFKFI
jgi:hypothetical protein